jgi:hypothetical protein
MQQLGSAAILHRTHEQKLARDTRNSDEKDDNSHTKSRPRATTHSAVKLQSRWRGHNARRQMALRNDNSFRVQRAWQTLMDGDICAWKSSVGSYLRHVQRVHGSMRDPVTGQIIQLKEQLSRVSFSHTVASEGKGCFSHTQPKTGVKETQAKTGVPVFSEGREIMGKLLTATPRKGQPVCLRLFGKPVIGRVVSVVVFLQTCAYLPVLLPKERTYSLDPKTTHPVVAGI